MHRTEIVVTYLNGKMEYIVTLVVYPSDSTTRAVLQVDLLDVDTEL